MTRLRLAFLGTPQFAVPTLHALIEAGHDIAAVYSQPPRPSGRGQRLQPSAVHLAAQAHGIPVRVPTSLKGSDEQAAFRALELDAAVVVAYGLILPKPVLSSPRLGCFNLHASLLPRWRGAAPIHRAVMEGDSITGAMVMRMEEGLDTGPVLKTMRTPISDATTTGELQELLAREGAKLMVDVLDALARGPLYEAAQSEDGVTYAKKITPEEARIDWSKPAHQVLRHIHGLSPSPGAWTMLGDDRLRILRVDKSSGGGAPGTVVGEPLIVACGQGAVRIEQLQRAGRGVQGQADFLRGFSVPIGTRFV